jgi:hypothetical protein
MTLRGQELEEAIHLADHLREAHNGIGGVYLYLGHDGDNSCRLKDGDADEVGYGCSGRGLKEAVLRARADWEARSADGRDPRTPLPAGDR